MVYLKRMFYFQWLATVPDVRYLYCVTTPVKPVIMLTAWDREVKWLREEGCEKNIKIDSNWPSSIYDNLTLLPSPSTYFIWQKLSSNLRAKSEATFGS